MEKNEVLENILKSDYMGGGAFTTIPGGKQYFEVWRNSVASGHIEIMQPDFSSNTSFTPMIFYNDVYSGNSYMHGFNGGETGPRQDLITFDNSYLGIGIDYDNGNIQLYCNGSLFCTYSYTWLFAKMDLKCFKIAAFDSTCGYVNIGKKSFGYPVPSGYKSIYSYLFGVNRLEDSNPNVFGLK